MKTANFITGLLLGVSSISASTIPSQPREVPDGFYQVTVDDAGQTTTEFTPYDQVVDVSLKPRSPLEKRREGCGPGSVNTNGQNAALDCLLFAFPGDIDASILLTKNSWAYCVRGDVVAFICPYSGGWKPKRSVSGTWDYVKRNCGPNKMGYAQVSNGQGDWTAGYALKSDHFCTKNFHAGD